MDVINPIEFRLMVSKINRRPYDMDYVKECLEETFIKQIGAIHTFVGITDSKPKDNVLHLYDEVEIEVPVSDEENHIKTVHGWRRKPIMNSTDPKDIFGYFKFMLENIDSMDVVFDPLGRKKTIIKAKTPPSRLKPPADKIARIWIEEKEKQLQVVSESGEITLESFFTKEPNKCIAFIEQELSIYSKPQGKLIAIMLIAFAELGFTSNLQNVKVVFHNVLKKRFGKKVGTRQAIFDYVAPYYDKESASAKQITKVEIDNIKEKIKNI